MMDHLPFGAPTVIMPSSKPTTALVPVSPARGVAQPSDLPRLCIGHARAFFNRVTEAEEDIAAQTLELILPAQRALHYKPKVSRALEQAIAARWRTMRSPYRFSFEARMDYKQRLCIRESRLADIGLRMFEWQDPNFEPNIAVGEFTFQSRGLVRAGIKIVRKPLALVSLHAAARLVQRAGREVSDSLFIDNLRPLAELEPNTADLGDMVIQAPDGEWHGRNLSLEVPQYLPAIAFAARTFKAKRALRRRKV